jgi:hypothetical protein
MKIIKESKLKESRYYKLMADIVTGVYEVKDFSYDNIYGKNIRVKPDDQDFFFDELSTLEEGEVIASLVDQDMYDKIKELYNIKK